MAGGRGLPGRRLPRGDVPLDLRHREVPGFHPAARAQGRGPRPDRRPCGAPRLPQLRDGSRSFDRALDQPDAPYRIVDRITGENVALSRADFDDLCRVHLFDWLEQVPRSQEWDYRRPAYRKMAERLGPAAEDDYEQTFAREETVTGTEARS